MNKTNIKGFIIKLALILFAITFIATLLLTVCNYVTKGQIQLIEKQNAEEAKRAVIENAEFRLITIDKEILKKHSSCGQIEAFRAIKSGKFAGYCINVQPSGYIGTINMIVGINPDLSFSGIKIISMSETPGLGAKAGEEAFYGQFAKGKKGELSVVKNSPSPAQNEINAVSGATITSKAVTRGANCALEIATELIEKEGKYHE